jgi:hypothetical protein
MTALDDRRQNAREAFWDDWGGEVMPGSAESFDVAIEVATRVQITPELLATMDPALGNRERRLKAAFRAAGFEVVE